MTLRKRNLLILACAIGLLAYVVLTGERDRLFAACLNGENDAEDISACTKLIDESDEIDAPLLARLYLNRAQKYVRLDQHEAALPDLDRAIALDDNHSTNYSQRAIVYSILGEYETALLDFETSLRLSPDSVWTLRWRANTYRGMKKYQMALNDYDAALLIAPKSGPTLTGRSRTLALLNRMEDALHATTDLLDVFPDDLWALKRRATLLANTEQFEPAIKDIERYIQIAPSYSRAHEMLGHYQGKLGQIDQAVEAFDRAIELDPDNISPLVTRINMWFDVENYEQVVVDAERAYELSPHDDTVLAALFTSYSKIGQDALADRYLDIWTRRQSEFRDIQQRLEYSLGKDHAMAALDTNVTLFKGLIYGAPPLERTDIAMKTIESYFQAAGPDAVLFFQAFLDRIGLYRGDFSGVYDENTSKALAACLDEAVMCLGEWAKQSAL